jgi:hypothetical protein
VGVEQRKIKGEETTNQMNKKLLTLSVSPSMMGLPWESTKEHIRRAVSIVFTTWESSLDFLPNSNNNAIDLGIYTDFRLHCPSYSFLCKDGLPHSEACLFQVFALTSLPPTELSKTEGRGLIHPGGIWASFWAAPGHTVLYAFPLPFTFGRIVSTQLHFDIMAQLVLRMLYTTLKIPCHIDYRNC